MAITNPLSSTRGGGLLGTGIGAGTTYNYDPSQYNPYKEYGGYSSALGTKARDSLSGMLNGQLSESTLALLGQKFSQNLAATREGAYGMPLGAQKGLETQAASENALSAAQLAEQQKNFAIQNTLGYEQLGQSDAQYGYGQNLNQYQYGQEWDDKQRQLMAQYSMQNKGDLNFGDILGGGISTFTGGLVGGLAGGLGTGLASKLLK